MSGSPPSSSTGRGTKTTPLTSLLVESDGPRRFGGELGGAPGEPAAVARVAAAIAGLRGLPLDETVALLGENTRRWLGDRFR